MMGEKEPAGTSLAVAAAAGGCALGAMDIFNFG